MVGSTAGGRVVTTGGGNVVEVVVVLVVVGGSVTGGGSGIVVVFCGGKGFDTKSPLTCMNFSTTYRTLLSALVIPIPTDVKDGSMMF